MKNLFPSYKIVMKITHQETMAKLIKHIQTVNINFSQLMLSYNISNFYEDKTGIAFDDRNLRTREKINYSLLFFYLFIRHNKTSRWSVVGYFTMKLNHN